MRQEQLVTEQEANNAALEVMFTETRRLSPRVFFLNFFNLVGRMTRHSLLQPEPHLWALLFVMLFLVAGCGHTPVTRTLVETFGQRPGVDGFNLNPALRYLRVTSGGREVLMVLGYADPHPSGEVETWYSASGEVLKLQNGRLLSTTGLKLDWRQVRYLGLPPWQSMVGSSIVRFERERDEMPGHRFGIRETVEISPTSPPQDAKLSGLQPETLRWLEERVVTPPSPMPSARFGLASRDAGQPPAVVYGEQCLKPDFCIAWQAWPVDPPRAASAP